MRIWSGPTKWNDTYLESMYFSKRKQVNNSAFTPLVTIVEHSGPTQMNDNENDILRCLLKIENLLRKSTGLVDFYFKRVGSSKPVY